MQTWKKRLGTLLLVAGLLHPAAGFALTLGQVDTFQDGTVQNWDAGLGGVEPLYPPEIIPGGGPDGVNDVFMQTESVEGHLPGSKLSVFNMAQWAGNYLAAGVNTITMSLKNSGPNGIYARVVVADERVGGLPPKNLVVSTQPLFLPSRGDWVSAVFSLRPGDFTAVRGNAATALTNARELRIIHNDEATFPPPTITARLGVDNIKAVRQDSLPFAPLLLLGD